MKAPLEKLRQEPYTKILCYPRPSKKEISGRLEQLRKLGIDAVEFVDGKKLFDVSVLGKGYVGIVIVAYKNQEKLALKIRRVDADRSEMTREAKLLQIANSVDVGPKLIGQTKDFLLMQFIDGKLLPEWLESKASSQRIGRLLRQTLEQCWRLDMAGLDHGELSYAPKHIIVDAKDRVFIVDFETASIARTPSNVTSMCQFLFISGLGGKVAEKLGKRDFTDIIQALRLYKKVKTRENFQRVLEVCGV